MLVSSRFGSIQNIEQLILLVELMVLRIPLLELIIQRILLVVIMVLCIPAIGGNNGTTYPTGRANGKTYPIGGINGTQRVKKIRKQKR